MSKQIKQKLKLKVLKSLLIGFHLTLPIWSLDFLPMCNQRAPGVLQWPGDPWERSVVFAQHGITGASVKPDEGICALQQEAFSAEFGDLHISPPSSPLVKPNSHLLLKPKIYTFPGTVSANSLSSPERRSKTKSFWFGFFHTYIEQ